MDGLRPDTIWPPRPRTRVRYQPMFRALDGAGNWGYNLTNPHNWMPRCPRPSSAAIPVRDRVDELVHLLIDVNTRTKATELVR